MEQLGIWEYSAECLESVYTNSILPWHNILTRSASRLQVLSIRDVLFANILQDQTYWVLVDNQF